MSNNFSMTPHHLVRYLQKSPKDFTRQDIVKYIVDHNIEMLNFRYVGGDGRLKTLNFVLTDYKQLDTLLSVGERVDGSSLFSYVEADSSDLYVVPRYSTAFVNPFTEVPTLDILCSYFNKDGEPLVSSPENIMRKALATLKEQTGYELDVMGELEYYVMTDKDDLFPAKDQRGYHESNPFAKFEAMRVEAMRAIAQAGGKIKYAHNEVGNFTQGDKYYEQNEIEFLPDFMPDAADQLIIAKWMLRMIAYKHGVTISFAPKITVGKAGSGMHVHMRLMKDGKTATVSNGKLSDEAKRAIAGILDIAPSLTAFGNTIPTSYLRLVPHQEAPTNVCWGDRNRSVLVRVPLGWTGEVDKMTNHINPVSTDLKGLDFSEKQTFEFRCPDGSADIYTLLAGLAVGARHGLQMADSLEKANNLYVDVNIFKDENKQKCDSLDKLPTSCSSSAKMLQKQKDVYLKYDVFPEGVINRIADTLLSYNDSDLSERLYGKNDEIRDLVMHYLHC